MTELNGRLSFESFVVGASNQVAAAAARAVAESPGTVYNPLFIYGSSGLGKTHLLTATGLKIRELSPGSRLEYLTAEEFFEAQHAATAAGHVDAFRKRYDEMDVLLLDDIQFMANRRDVQNEVLRIVGGKRQLVVVSDRSPMEVAGMDARLAKALAGGLLVDIARPDYETRLGILRRRAEERGAEFDPGVLEAAAQVEMGNVRELIGALNRLVAFQAVSEMPVTPAAAAAMLGDLQPGGAPAELSVVHDRVVTLGGDPTAPGGDLILTGDSALMPDELQPALRGSVRPPPPPAPPEVRAPRPAAAAPTAGPEPKGDEFSQFLSGVQSTVARQVEVWKTRVGEAILRWEGEGYQTNRLGAVLDRGAKHEAETALQQFEKDVEQLRSFETEIAALDPGSAGSSIFRDPDRVREAAALVERAREGTSPPPGPSGAWAFEGFRIGESNKMAYNAALAVVETPGTRYNPLVLVGAPGIGKTHLLHGLGNALSAGAGALVACLSGQDYVDELLQADESNRVDQWRSRYRRASAFLLDDVQLLASRDRAQDELFDLANYMIGEKRQLVFTVSASPQELEGLQPRIVSLLERGLVAGVDRPDRNLRVSMVARQLSERLGSVDPDLAEYLGTRPAESVRVLQGMVQRVLRAAEAESVTPDVAFARDLLEGPAPQATRTSSGVRTSGILVTPAATLRSREKVVWRWPDASDRLIQELG
ncbi:MAG: ATP-binding protein [Gemmatimonadetes bacterium]|nr:ATP-binding protein [Gemmatimonadota bacterium]